MLTLPLVLDAQRPEDSLLLLTSGLKGRRRRRALVGRTGGPRGVRAPEREGTSWRKGTGNDRPTSPPYCLDSSPVVSLLKRRSPQSSLCPQRSRGEGPLARPPGVRAGGGRKQAARPGTGLLLLPSHPPPPPQGQRRTLGAFRGLTGRSRRDPPA